MRTRQHFIKKLDGNHPIKDVAIFIGGVLTGAALASSKDGKRLSDKEKENIFIKRNSDEKFCTSSENNNSDEVAGG